MLHVIEIRDGVVHQMDTFTESEEDIAKAHELFFDRARHAGACIEDDEYNNYLNDGYIEYNHISGSVCLTHSTLTI